MSPRVTGIVLMVVIATVMLAFCAPVVLARDDFDYPSDPATKQWYRSLMQPDAPNISCCGEADAYWVDSWEMDCSGDGECKYVAIITDTRDDAPLGRPHVRPGTKVVVPNRKLKFDAGNPTGHGVIFMRYDDENDAYGVLCFVVPGGV